MAEPINSEWFRAVLTDPSTTLPLALAAWAFVPTTGSRGLRDAGDCGADTSRPTPTCHRLAMRLDSLLPRCPDPGMALANVERFVSACPRPHEMIVLLAESARTTEILVQLFSTSQHLCELMTRDPSLLDWLRSGAERRDRDAMIFDLWAELGNRCRRERAALVLRRLSRQRETLRIGYNDIEFAASPLS